MYQVQCLQFKALENSTRERHLAKFIKVGIIFTIETNGEEIGENHSLPGWTCELSTRDLRISQPIQPDYPAWRSFFDTKFDTIFSGFFPTFSPLISSVVRAGQVAVDTGRITVLPVRQRGEQSGCSTLS
ncbi:MAG: hypothetical protein IGS50_23230 [Synechococcales cyanobacterium C42_A2020_086]|nr:hypothetical protein [Synechococcales cyanobacterium C42_A2020_086]